MAAMLTSFRSSYFFFFNDTATTEIYTRSIVGSVRCVQETGTWGEGFKSEKSKLLDSVKVKDKLLSSVIYEMGEMIYRMMASKKPDSLLPTSQFILEKMAEDRHMGISYPPTTFISSQAAMRAQSNTCLLYTSPSPRDLSTSRMPSSA
eukprot:TRINITY_DN23606_c0_g1_i2.p1 TRINITY_DN23606_c0_g1~~TRINITY_DN23606_c0_g1_i2.p1  ORF type:complete len:148 (-),score=39.58 TRINITY_DN23606_c0_g1_i2:79-522(-)